MARLNRDSIVWASFGKIYLELLLALLLQSCLVQGEPFLLNQSPYIIKLTTTIEIVI